MNLLNYAGIGAIWMAIAGAWTHIKSIFGWFMDLIICRAILGKETAEAVTAYVWANGKRSPFGLKMFSGSNVWVNPHRRVELVAYEGMTSQPILFWFKGRPIIIARKEYNADTGAVNTGEDNGNSAIYIYFFRGTINIDVFISNAIKYLNGLLHCVDRTPTSLKRFRVTRLSGHGSHEKDVGGRSGFSNYKPRNPFENDNDNDDLLIKAQRGTVRLLDWSNDDLRLDSKTAFNGLIFPPKVTEHLDEVRSWLDSKDWFTSRGVPWRRGWLLYGPPGTGKSSLVRALGLEFDLPVYSLDLSSMTNAVLCQNWDSILGNTPCIALIEDIDNVFHGRINVTGENKIGDILTFDCLLNCISGVGMNDGIFLIITTNQLDKLDAALGIPSENLLINRQISTRPGRVDRVIYLGSMEEDERRKLGAFILSDYPHEIEPLVQMSEGMTPAQVQNLFAERACKLFWDEKKK